MTIAVAISGGVDSLLALKLLQEKGRDIIALHVFFLDPGQEMHRVARDLEDKCAHLHIPFYLLDLSREFRESVIDPFVSSYVQGLTPNPCAVCNRRMKFGMLLDRARDLGAEKLATGHYVGLDRIHGQKVLVRGADKDKEQSYFLSLLTADQLERACFPLAGWRKVDTYRALQERSLSPVNKQESQEICFIPGRDYREFVRDRMETPPPSGPVRDSRGNVLGKHQGLYRYTIGQRRGLGISYPQPLYVLGKDIENNVLIVGTSEECVSSGCRVKDVNFVLDTEKWPEQIFVQTRYRQEAVPARVEIQGEDVQVGFLDARKPATPGQIAAFYTERGEILGAGIIHE